jgi:putative IMPACT (imprinted ancient) family translation regulator
MGHQGQVVDETFAGEVTVTARLPQERFAAFQASLREISRGTIEAQVMESSETTIMPLETGG